MKYFFLVLIKFILVLNLYAKDFNDYTFNWYPRIIVEDDVIVFPQDSKEKKVIVNGVFTKIEFTEDQAIKWKIHLAEEKGLKLGESDVTLDSSDLIEYRIKLN